MGLIEFYHSIKSFKDDNPDFLSGITKATLIGKLNNEDRINASKFIVELFNDASNSEHYRVFLLETLSILTGVEADLNSDDILDHWTKIYAEETVPIFRRRAIIAIRSSSEDLPLIRIKPF